MKNTILLLPACTTTRAERIARAYNRHSNPATVEAWAISAEGYITPACHAMTPAQIYQLADLATFFALRARESATGVDMFRKLAWEAKPDQARRHGFFNEELKNIFTRTSSDREELVNHAITAILANTNPADMLKEATNGAGAFIAQLAHPDALTSTRTTVTAITEAEANKERETHPPIIDPATGKESPAKVQFNVKGGNSAGFYTIEWRQPAEPKKNKDGSTRETPIKYPAGWYRVNHYHTLPPYVSFETFATGEASEPIAKNNSINAINNITAREEVETIINVAHLTEREKLVIYKLIDQTAEAEADRAYWEAMHAEAVKLKEIAKIDRKHFSQEKERAKKRINKAYDSALWNSAFTRAGIESENVREKLKANIQNEFREYKPAINEALTPAELTALGMTRKPRAFRVKQPARADLVTWAIKAPARACKPVIRWAELAEACQTLTASEREAIQARAEAERKAHIEAHKAEAVRVAFRREQIASPAHRAPAFPALDAQWIALRMWDRMTEAEQDKTIAQAKAEAEARAELDRMAERTARAERAQREKVQISVAEFNRQTKAERLSFLTACNYCFDLIK